MDVKISAQEKGPAVRNQGQPALPFFGLVFCFTYPASSGAQYKEKTPLM